jgi:hypothetical protein
MCGDQLSKEAHDRKTAHLKKGDQSPVALKSAQRETRGRTAERIAKLAKVGRDVAREALRTHKDGPKPKKKKSPQREIPFSEQVLKKFQRFMDRFPVTKHREVRKILIEFLSE